MSPLRVTFWYVLWSVCIIFPNFLENEHGPTITDNGETYRIMVNDFFVPALPSIDVSDV